MNLQLITTVLESPTDVAIQALFDDDKTIFWIDWKHEDDLIPGACERVLQTGCLRGELVEVDNTEGFEVYIHYRDRKGKVPLNYTGEDRHITIWALNEMLKPDYEIRLSLDSAGSDTLGFVPLATDQWAELEARYGGTVAKHFYKIPPYPNVFTDPLPVEPVKPIVTGHNVALVHYCEYPHPLGMSAFAFLTWFGQSKAEIAARVPGLVDKSQMTPVELPLHKVRNAYGANVDEFHQWPDVALQFLNGRLEGAITPPTR